MNKDAASGMMHRFCIIDEEAILLSSSVNFTRMVRLQSKYFYTESRFFVYLKFKLHMWMLNEFDLYMQGFEKNHGDFLVSTHVNHVKAYLQIFKEAWRNSVKPSRLSPLPPHLQ